jgi:dipeptidyl aminopeptidase/acylaminoacyl peptidase
VIEPRFRGFNGGDQWFYANGFGGWQTSVGDISASAKYLVGQGIADPNRMAIIGWRNGGYDALLSAEVEPSLFKAIVAIDPITDLTTYKADWYDYTAGKRIAKLVGNAELSGSPIRRASAIRAQVLLAHGTLDAGVRITQSREMRDALRQAGIQSELVEFAGLDGEIADSTARASLLLKIGQLLDRTIGH